MLICTNILTCPDPLNWAVVDVPCPEGYGQVFSGRIQPGDLYYNRRHGQKQVDGKGESLWLSAWPVRADLDPLYHQVSTYCSIIRPGVPSEKPCERCGHQGRFKGERFCLYCGQFIVRKGRRKHARS